VCFWVVLVTQGHSKNSVSSSLVLVENRKFYGIAVEFYNNIWYNKTRDTAMA